MRTVLAAVVLLSSACSSGSDGTPAPNRAAVATESDPGIHGKGASETVMLLQYDQQPTANGGPPSAGPMARVEGILEANGSCIRLRMQTEAVPLVFEKGTAVSANANGIRLTNGEVVPFGAKVELAGSRVNDRQGTYPMDGVAEACSTRDAILVTAGTLRRLTN